MVALADISSNKTPSVCALNASLGSKKAMQNLGLKKPVKFIINSLFGLFLMSSIT